MIKRSSVFALILIFVLPVSAAPLKTNKQRTSYIMGYRMAIDMKRQGLNLDPSAVSQGIRDFNRKKKPVLTNKQIAQAMKYAKKRMLARRVALQKKLKALAATNLKKSNAFLAQNKKADGVKTTSSGLQYKVIREGKGKKPKITDEVVVHYRGTFVNGKVFDSSYKRGKPTTFTLGNVIKGWQEALKLMRKGSKLKVFIPPDLAYGLRGRPNIAPNEALIFDIELIDFRKQKKS